MFEMIERCYLQGKNMKVSFFVPFFAFYILVPLYAYVKYTVEGNWTYFDCITDVSLDITPVVCVWWIYLILKEYIEGDGNEILILKGGIISVVGNYFCLTILCYLPVFLLRIFCEDEPLDLFLPLCVITFFMYGLVLTISFLFRNISMAILIVLLYSIYNSIFFNFNDGEMPLQYTDMYGLYWADYAAPFLTIGCILWGIAIWKSKKLQ